MSGSGAVDPTRRPELPRPVVLLLGTGGAVATVLGMQYLSWLVGPFFLALVIVVLVHPLHVWLQSRRVPEPLALLLLLAGIYGVIVALAAILALSLARLAGLLPGYAAESGALLQSLAGLLQGWGVAPGQIRSLVSSLDTSRVVAGVSVLLRHAASFGATVALLFSLLLFLGIESTGADRRLAIVDAARPQLAQALRDVVRNTRRFLAVTLVFGLICGFANTLLLWALGIPLALLWGLLAAVCNFIPYVGFLIGLVPPALLALLGGDVRVMVFVIVTYIVLNSVITSLVGPKFVGDSVGISTTITMISVVFWSWVLGPLGAVLAIPLTLLVKALLVDADPGARWLTALVGSAATVAADPAVAALPGPVSPTPVGPPRTPSVASPPGSPGAAGLPAAAPAPAPSPTPGETAPRPAAAPDPPVTVHE